MRLTFQIDDRASERISQLGGEVLGVARRRCIDDAAREVLATAARLNPVDTGRSRAAWEAALQQLNGDAVGSDGPTASAAISEGRASGSLSRSDDDNVTSVAVTNAVHYVPFLEYGTSRMAPFAMARRALASVIPRLGVMFQLKG